MKWPSLMNLFVFPVVLPLVFACSDDGKSDDTTSGSSSTEQGDGDGDSSGDGDGDNTGDGDGDNTGDGDGDNTGDGDSGDGDGDSGDGDGDTGDGDGDTGDGDGDACQSGETLCDGECVDTSNDPGNCGMCGHACEIVDNIGGCSDSVCEPTFTECIVAEDPPASCDEVCAGDGKTCVEDGCDGTTMVWYGSFNMCEMFAGTEQANPCSFPMDAGSNLYRCCCGEI